MKPIQYIKSNIQVFQFGKIQKERNPGIVRSLQNAVNALHQTGVIRIYLHIDGDTDSYKTLFLN